MFNNQCKHDIDLSLSTHSINNNLHSSEVAPVVSSKSKGSHLSWKSCVLTTIGTSDNTTDTSVEVNSVPLPVQGVLLPPRESPLTTSNMADRKCKSYNDVTAADTPYYFPPTISDVPTSSPDFYVSSSERVPNSRPASDREDEPLLDLSCCTEVDHCHAASSNNGKDTAGNKQAQRQLIFAAVVCFLFMVGEFTGGYLSSSLAIMTDAAHLLSDFTSFLISLFALRLALKPPTARMSFGYFRAEVLGAVISVLIIWVATGVLVYLAVQRVITPDVEIDGKIMLITASCGLAVNIVMAIVLKYTGHGHSHGGLSHSHGPSTKNHSHKDHRSSSSTSLQNGYSTMDANSSGTALSVRDDDTTALMENDVEDHTIKDPKKRRKPEGNLNVRAAFVHVIGDLIQSIGVCIAAIIILVRPDYKIADPICTFIFSVLVMITTIIILRDAIQVLMEGVPKHIVLSDLRADLKNLPHVKMAHGLHVWSLTTSQAAMAVHLCIDADVNSEDVLQEASQLVRDKYNIIFSTIQVERYQPEVMSNCNRCQEPPS